MKMMVMIRRRLNMMFMRMVVMKRFLDRFPHGGKFRIQMMESTRNSLCLYIIPSTNSDSFHKMVLAAKKQFGEMRN